MSSTWINPENKNKLLDVLKTQKYLVVYDLETTGLSPTDNRIIEFSAVRYKITENAKLIEDEKVTYYIRQPEPLPEKITELTGYTDEFLADKPVEQDVIEDIISFMEDSAITGYNNTNFDDKFMQNLYARYGYEFTPYVSFDVYLLAKEFISCKSYKLCNVASELGVADDITFHKAFDDIIATARVLNAIIPMCIETSSGSGKKTVKANVVSVAFWEGFRGFSRIYVNTDIGTVFYNIRLGHWDTKDAPIEQIDMAQLEKDAWKAVGASSEKEFSRFKGEIKVPKTV